ncbi:hypothetical protein COCSUDRAFT_58878 [Coccomyxa subellipsoidea C-169]|uniref:Glycoside hydrolase n=1 Tax=Coccomyxa subellipsoidea (strain C-169) TaxID=574566 RepID=I0Z6S2_COCSC|nr:hypothetical protein COCSUDRAFT_58878 [Coccomyxa subellipsoidea C-169]EIE26341.1 hypothetical protein COCSUDRAFT_58878 [Coccomyxa subellipsoidea C-169]|eukprot:XP_005650885.1 hypothetical protein COCSUDRAFT_58878 [Coccomyxa subellipsoidea C-169]
MGRVESLSINAKQAGLDHRRSLNQVPAPTDNSSIAAADAYFVSVSADRNFALGCQKYFIAGWNTWELMEAAAGAPVLYGASLPLGVTGPQLIRGLMDKAVGYGLNVMRAWAHSVSDGYALQTAPSQFNEAIFRGLDYALDQARRRGLKARPLLC